MSSRYRQARESFASILGYYKRNRSSLENVLSGINELENKEIVASLSSSAVPSDEQTEQYKEELKELLTIQETINKLTDNEKNVMSQAVNSSCLPSVGLFGIYTVTHKFIRCLPLCFSAHPGT
ncbi:hypothetical protein F5884DRAFT_861358 [Xylogone sp. PMI_703]|nr:hypothetical protein F5884DRAFT_861358 [Xylogone sp. PMI_703]